MTKSIKILLIALAVTVVLAGGVFGYSYYQNANQKKKAQANIAKKTPAPVKDANTKESDSIQTDLKSLDDLDLTELNNISKEFDQINLNGI